MHDMFLEVEAMQAPAIMSRTGQSLMSVVEGDHLRGIFTLKDLFGLESVKLEFQAA